MLVLVLVWPVSVKMAAERVIQLPGIGWPALSLTDAVNGPAVPPLAETLPVPGETECAPATRRRMTMAREPLAPPSVATMLVDPSPTAVTRPVPAPTVATPVALLLHTKAPGEAI